MHEKIKYKSKLSKESRVDFSFKRKRMIMMMMMMSA